MSPKRKKLKAMALQNDLFYTNFKKDDLMCLLKAYNEVGSKKSTKKELGETLLHVLKKDSCVKMVDVSIFENNEPNSVTGCSSKINVSKESGKGKQLLGKRKATKKSSTHDINDGRSIKTSTLDQNMEVERQYYTRSSSGQASKGKQTDAECSYELPSMEVGEKKSQMKNVKINKNIKISSLI
jgi:hypothetical protein